MSGLLQGPSGSRDPRVRYDVLKPCSGKDGWLRIGIAYLNPDGTIDAYLEVIPIGTHLRLRELAPSDSPPDVDVATTPRPPRGNAR